MKIALATQDGNVSSHFGHCRQFTLIDIENGQVTDEKVVESPGHRPGYLPVFLGDMGVNVVISGGMGASAISLFNGNDITVITGAEGKIGDVVKSYLEGTLVSTGSACKEHEHRGDCGNH